MSEPARRERPLRVLYSFPHPLGAPGIGTTAWYQVAGLAAAGVRVHVVCTSLARPFPAGAGVTVTQTMVVGGRRVPHRALGVDRTWRRHDRLVARLLTASPGRYDLLHAWPRACLASLRAARMVGVPGLREAPSPHTASALADAAAAAASVGVRLPRGHSHAPDPGLLTLEQAEYDAASVVLVPSGYARSTFLAAGTDPARLRVHRYGCDLERFRPGDQPVRPDALHAVFLGRGEPNKGLHLALDAWRASAAAWRGRLTVAGDILPDYRRQLAGSLSHPGVRTVGRVADPAGLLRTADVLVLPTFTEGSALVTFEARASGAVLAVSDRAGAPGTDGVDVLLHRAGDLAELTGQLDALATAPARLAGLRARSLAGRAELGWDAAGRCLAEIYRSVYDEAVEGRLAAP